MVEIDFTYNGTILTILCNLEDKLKDICQKFATKADLDLESLLFLCNGKQLDLDSLLSQLKIDSNKINILVYDNNYLDKLFLKFNLKDIKNNSYDIVIYFSGNLEIMAEHKDIFPKKKYKNSFSLNELKNKSNFLKYMIQ